MATIALPAGATASPSPAPFQVENFHITPSTTQAAAHEDLTTSFDFAHEPNGQTHNDVRTTVVNLPPGFIGNNTAVPVCTVAQLIGNRSIAAFGNPECPPASQVGIISFECVSCATGGSGNGLQEVAIPLYNMQVTSFGVAAAFGFDVAGNIVEVLPVTVRPGDSGLTVTAPTIEKGVEPHNVSVTVWGLPASHEHDAQRQLECYSAFLGTCATNGGKGPNGLKLVESPHPVPANIPVKPYLSNPTSCGPHIATMVAYSWEHPEEAEWSRADTEIGPITECDRVPFAPEIEATPTTSSAESSSGLDFSMDVPQAWDNPVSLATAHLDDAVVTLPEGMSLNPSAGSGLGVCTEEELKEMTFDSPPTVGCPPESRVGTVEVETPVLFEKAQGSVYVAKPFQNPFNSLLALYIVAKIPERGVIVKVAGRITPDPLTGQLVTTFEENPQVPFSKFTLKFRQGATSPLVSPPVCGKYAALADLTPWSAPLSPKHLLSEFEIEHGIGGGPCPSGGTPPFHPGLIAGSINPVAGAYSPFYIRLSRNDGEQEITHFSIKLPPGVIGKLAGIPLCGDAAIAAAKAREHDGGGGEEEADPSCPAASEIGHTLVEAGVGTVLAQAPGRIYLAGPYHGSVISVVAITDAHVGPFDLGTVVVREGLKIDPDTGEVFVDATGSDPLPHIVDGIPTHLRAVRIYMDRPEFVLNPTSCEPTSTASTVLGSGKDFVSEADDVPVVASSPFQAADCASLPFKPKLKLSLSGNMKRTKAPALRAELTMRPGEANVGRSVVVLPHSEYLFNAHIANACGIGQFRKTGSCPAGSVYGHAMAQSPLLDEPLQGPVYLMGGLGHKLPDLYAVLKNKQVEIHLDGRVDSLHRKVHGEAISLIRNTFEPVPDAPVSKFVLEMEGGNKGLLQNSENLCKGTHKAISEFTAHSGKIYDTKPVVVAAGCKGKKGGKGKHRRHTG